jgi:hypothetical protein
MRVEQGDFWLGFSVEQMNSLLHDAGFAPARGVVAGSDPSHDRLSAMGWAATVR